MEELVYLKKDEALTDSLSVAKYFHKRHSHVIDKIEKLVTENSATQKMFKFSKYKANDNQMHRICYMNRDGFTLLVMGFNGKKALEWKLKYIEAFNSMEKVLMEKGTSTWLETRQAGKLTRKAETDVIQELVEYAKAQGSTHSDKLYMTYSKLANSMANIKKRDNASTKQLNELGIFENIILMMIRNGINEGLGYKEIYQVCKARCNQAKEIAFIS